MLCAGITTKTKASVGVLKVTLAYGGFTTCLLRLTGQATLIVFLDRAVSAASFTYQLVGALERKSTNWFLS
jgi:hypothetical protein